MYLGNQNIGALTFRTLFEKAQKLVTKAKDVTGTAEKVVDTAKQYIPTSAPMPSEIPASSATGLPMSVPPKPNLLMIGGIAAGALLLMKMLKRR